MSGSDQVQNMIYLGAQTRQFGVGSVSTKGKGSSVLDALAHPPTAMETAAAAELHAPVVTNNDLGRYFPSSDYYAPAAAPD